GQARAVRARFADGRRFPFGLGRKPALGPVAPGLRLVPVDECHRRVRRGVIDLVVAPPRPAAPLVFAPLDRLLGPTARPPGPGPPRSELPGGSTRRFL